MLESELPPDPFETQERRLLRATVRSFVERSVVPHIEEWEQAGEVPRWVHQEAAAAGILGISFSEDVGGSGGSIIDLAVLYEELILAGGTSGLCAALLTHGIAIPHIVASGDQNLIERYARPTLAGEKIGALAVTEPDAGSDVARLRTQAVPDGDDYVVSGSKMFITSGARADFVTTAVRTGEQGHRGISLLVMDTAAPGFTVSRRLPKMGWLLSDTAELAFDGVRVPRSNLVGEEGSGFRQIMTQFQVERAFMAVEAYATAQRCVDLSVRWVQSRETFGVPLASHQVVRHQVADMARRAAAARALTREAVRALAAGEEASMLVAMAKNTAVEACDMAVDRAVQLHGGLGYMRGVEVERHYRDAKILGIGGGANEIMNEIIAKRLLQ